MKCYNCVKYGNYLTMYLKKKKGDNEKKKGKQIIGATASSELDNISRKLEHDDFSM